MPALWLLDRGRRGGHRARGRPLLVPKARLTQRDCPAYVWLRVLGQGRAQTGLSRLLSRLERRLQRGLDRPYRQVMKVQLIATARLQRFKTQVLAGDLLQGG